MGSRSRAWATPLLATAFLVCLAAAAEAQSMSFNGGGSYHQFDASTQAPDITVTCAGGYWGSTNHIRINIPAGLNFVWDNSVVPTYSGAMAGSMTAPSLGTSVQYLNGAKTVRLQITTTFLPANSVVIQGLRFRTFGAPCSGQIFAVWDGNDASLTPVTAPQIFTIVDNPSVTAVGGSQIVNPPGLPSNFNTVTCNPIQITDGNTNPGINLTQDLKISIPPGLNMTWDPNQTTVGIAMTLGTTGNVSTTILGFENGNKTVILDVTASFSAGRRVTISNLRFANIGNDTGPLSLTVTTNGATTPGPNDNQATDGTTKEIIGVPTVSMSTNPNRYTVGDAAILAPMFTIRNSPVTPIKITAASDLALVLPVGMQWNQTIDTVGEGLVFGGAGAARVTAAASKIVYDNARTARILIDVNFAVDEVLTVSGLQFTNFTAAIPSTSVTLNTVETSTSTETVAVGAPILTSQGVPPSGQIFVVDADASVTAPAAPIKVDDDAQVPAINRITTAGIRIRIPSTPPPVPSLVWDTTVMNVSCTGSAFTAGFMAGNAGVTYEDGGKTAVIAVAGNWTGNGRTVTISGLVFKNFTAAMTPRLLGLSVNGALPSGTICDNDATIIAVGGIPKLDSLADRSFTFNDPAAAVNLLTITDAGGLPFFTTVTNITVKIPTGFPMEWNTLLRRRSDGLTFAGTGVGHIPPLVGDIVISYPDVKTAVITVSSNFAAAETLTINGLQYRNFTNAHDFDRLELYADINGAPVLDSKTIGIGRPAIALASGQAFGQGDPSSVLNQVTVTEDGFVPRITTQGIEIQIPGGLTMDWDTTITTTAAGLSFGGTGSGHVTANPTKVTYVTTKIARIDLDTAFLVNETLTIDGLRLMNFTASGPLGLNLEVNNSGTVCRTTVQTISIGARPQLVSMTTSDSNGNGSLDRMTLVFDKDIDPATSSATAGVGFTITVPSYTIGAGSVTGKTLTLNLVEKGTPDTGVRPLIAYNPAVGNLQELGTGLEIAFTGPQQAADGAAPIATGLSAVDSDNNGHLDTIVVTFSEALATGQEDIADWRIIDADGTTNLLQGLTSSAILISGNTVTFTLADSSGTAGTPRYVYTEDPVNPNRIEDLFNNGALLQTNNGSPVVDVGSSLAVGPSKVTLDASRSVDPQGQPLTFSWVMIPPTFAIQNADTATPFFLATTAGTYTLQVTVSNALTSAIGTVDVTILNVPPGADAGSPQTVNPGFAPVYLVPLASSDANGDPLTLTWAQLPGVAGGAPAGVLTPAGSQVMQFTAPAPSLVMPPNNILTFELTAFDGVNTTKALTQVRLNRSAAVVAPTANAGPDQIAMVGLPVTLDGSLSLDPAGGALPLQYKWTSTTPLSDDTVSNPTFTPALPGLYTFQLVVTNPNAVLSSFPSTVKVLVHSPTNQAPVAVAHRFQPTGEIVVGDLVILDGTGSRDPEGKPVTYAWTQTVGPKVILAGTGALQASFTPVRSALYSFQLVVSDGVNQSLPASVSMTVKDLPSDVTYATTITYGAGINPDGTALLSTGPLTFNVATVGPTTWYWYLHQTLGPSATINSSTGGQLLFPPGSSYTVTPSVAGTYRFRLAATTLFTAIRAYADITVVVHDDIAPPNLVPTADAGTPQTITAGNLVTLDSSGSADDSGGTLRTYWVQREGPPVALDPYSASPSFTPKAAGQYTFELTVADTTTQSAPSFVVVTVDPAPAPAPISGGGNGGCGFLGLEGLLVLPLIWLASWLRNRARTRRQAA